MKPYFNNPTLLTRSSKAANALPFFSLILYTNLCCKVIQNVIKRCALNKRTCSVNLLTGEEVCIFYLLFVICLCDDTYQQTILFTKCSAAVYDKKIKFEQHCIAHRICAVLATSRTILLIITVYLVPCDSEFTAAAVVSFMSGAQLMFPSES